MFEPADYNISVVSQPNMSAAPPELFLGLMRTAEGYLLLDSNKGFDEINICFPLFCVFKYILLFFYVFLYFIVFFVFYIYIYDNVKNIIISYFFINIYFFDKINNSRGWNIFEQIFHVRCKIKV